MKKNRVGRHFLAEYRRLQREIRDIYDPFTERSCAACATPCCVQPTRVSPFDVALALGVGHRFAHLEGGDDFRPAVRDVGTLLALPMADSTEQPIAWCEYLREGRCSFPDDLRPFGCVAYVCPPMFAGLSESVLRRLRRLLRQLREAHEDLLRASRGAERR